MPESWVPEKRGSEVFRPRARVICTLGRDLIQNPYVAVQELVKNSYDADAHLVRIAMRGPFVKGEGSLEIEDDGEGMSLEVVQSAWMQPATIYKKRQIKTPGGRRVTGEKGIGRFASARIAQRLELDSVSNATSRRVVARFNWGDFDSEERFLDEVKSEWEEGACPPNRGQGTILRLSQLNDSWGADEFRALGVALSTLLPPTGPGEDFRIDLQVHGPAGEQISGPVVRPAILERPRYRLHGEMAADWNNPWAPRIRRNFAGIRRLERRPGESGHRGGRRRRSIADVRPLRIRLPCLGSRSRQHGRDRGRSWWLERRGG